MSTKKPKGSDVGASKPKRRKSESSNSKNGLAKKVADKTGKVKAEIEFVAGNSEESQLARALYSYSGHIWSGTHFLPPDTILDEVVSEFERKTDIPLEIPFMFTLEMILTYLIHKEVTIKLPGVEKPLECDASAIIVADSGCSKTVATSAISEAFNLEKLIWESHAVSSAKWMEELCGVEDKDGSILTESNNRKVLFIDEFPEWFLKVRTPSSPMGDTYRDVLQIYDNKPVGRDTVKKNIYCEKPVINIVGLGPFETFIEELTVKDLVSGLIFRFAVIRAKSDPMRPLSNYPIYKIKLNSKKFQRLLSSIEHTKYIEVIS